ncbi:hypothetical protein Tco_1127905 [Tanacetum coccineum]
MAMLATSSASLAKVITLDSRPWMISSWWFWLFSMLWQKVFSHSSCFACLLEASSMYFLIVSVKICPRPPLGGRLELYPSGDAFHKLDILPGLRERFPSASSCLVPGCPTCLPEQLSFGRCHPKNWSLRIKQMMVHSAQTFIEDVYLLMAIDVLLRGLGWWAIPLDKGLFEEIPGIDSSWGESVYPSLRGSGQRLVEFFEGWKPLSPLQLAVKEVMSE